MKVAKKRNLHNTTFYVNPHLSPEFRNLSFNCRQLKKAELIEDTWCHNGKIFIKHNDEEIETVSHEIDLYKNFPQFTLFSFDTARYEILKEEASISVYEDLEGIDFTRKNDLDFLKSVTNNTAFSAAIGNGTIPPCLNPHS